MLTTLPTAAHPSQAFVVWLAAAALGPRVAAPAGGDVGADDGAVAEPAFVEQGNFPNRVHVFEDYETEIERWWWLRGKRQADDVPPDGDGKYACRGTESDDFDDLMGAAAERLRG